MDSAMIDQKIEKSLFASDEMLSMNLGQLSDSDVSWVTDENRPLVIQRLRERYQQSGLNSPDYLKKALVLAGDWEATLEMIEDIKDPHSSTDTLIFAGEKIIPHLIPLICNRVPAEKIAGKPSDDEIQTHVLDRAIHYFMLILSDSTTFPAETVEWVGNGFATDTPEQGEASAAVIANWWEHNKEAILEKRYQDAKWLPAYKTSDKDPYRTRREKEEREILSYLKQDKAKRNGSTGSPGETVQSSTSRAGEASLRLICIGIGAGVMGAGYYLWQRFGAKAA